jgi:hypothetical protein
MDEAINGTDWECTVCLFSSLPYRTVFTECLSVLSYLSCTMQILFSSFTCRSHCLQVCLFSSLPCHTVFTECLSVLPANVQGPLFVYSSPCRTVFTECVSVLPYLSCMMQIHSTEWNLRRVPIGNFGFLRKYKVHCYIVFA